MARHRKKLLIIPALLLPILFGMTPLNFIHKIGCPLAQGKQVLKCNPCPFDSIVSQPDQGMLGPSVVLYTIPSPSRLDSNLLTLQPFFSNPSTGLLPLRC